MKKLKMTVKVHVNAYRVLYKQVHKQGIISVSNEVWDAVWDHLRDIISLRVDSSVEKLWSKQVLQL